MPSDISDRLPTLFAAIHNEVAQLLTAHAVYDILTYGWLDHDTIDTEYAGHATWQTDPPFEPDWTALFNGSSVSYVPTAADEVLLLNGKDFIGTMIFARRSLGMALFCGMVVNPNFIDENLEFWHEYATTLQWLNIASDRLRDFFLMARFKQTKKEYQYKKRQRSEYDAPFKEGLDGASHDMQQLLHPLLGIASQLQSHRKERNEIVHKVATTSAMRSIKILREQRRNAVSRNTFQVPELSSEEPQAAIANAPPGGVLDAPIENMKRWYTRLIDASNLVFQFEYLNRVRKE